MPGKIILCIVCDKKSEQHSKGGRLCKKCANKRYRNSKQFRNNSYATVGAYRCPKCGYKITTANCVLCDGNASKQLSTLPPEK